MTIPVPPKTKTLTYKVADIEGDLRFNNLQDFLDRLFDHWPRALDRRESRGGSGASRLILHRQTHRRMTCGILSSYTEGAAAPIVDLDADDENLRIDSLAPNLTGRERAQFLEGLLYFSIFRNHVIISQSTRQRVGGFEDHINWLVHRWFGRDHNTPTVFLADQPSPEKLQQIFRAKEIVMKAPLEMDASSGVVAHPCGNGWHGIRAFVGRGFRWGRDIQLPGYVKSGRIKTELAVKWVSETPEDGTPLLDNLATVLRRDDTIDYTIHLGDGGKITRDDIKLSTPVTVLHRSAEEADMNSMFDAMHGWLDRLHEARRILS